MGNRGLHDPVNIMSGYRRSFHSFVFVFTGLGDFIKATHLLLSYRYLLISN